MGVWPNPNLSQTANAFSLPTCSFRGGPKSWDFVPPTGGGFWLVRFSKLKCLWMLLVSLHHCSVVHIEFQLWRLPVLWIRFYPNKNALFGCVCVGGVTLLLTIITEGPSALLPANFQATSRFTYLKKHWCSIFNSIYIFTWPLHQYSKYQIVHTSPHQRKHPIIN